MEVNKPGNTKHVQSDMPTVTAINIVNKIANALCEWHFPSFKDILKMNTYLSVINVMGLCVRDMKKTLKAASTMYTVNFFA